MSKGKYLIVIIAILSFIFVALQFYSVNSPMRSPAAPITGLSIVNTASNSARSVPRSAASSAATSVTPALPRADDTARHAAMFFENSPDMRDMRKTLLGEARDTSWADAAESSLRTSFSEMPGLAKDGRMLNIRCGSATCEVAGELAPGAEGASAMKEMQGMDFRQAMEDRGYRRTIMGFAPSSVTDRGIFLAYYQRGPAR